MTNHNFSKQGKYLTRSNGANIILPEDDVKEMEKKLKDNTPVTQKGMQELFDTLLAKVEDTVGKKITESDARRITENESDQSKLLEEISKLRSEQNNEKGDDKEILNILRLFNDKLDELLAEKKILFWNHFRVVLLYEGAQLK